MKIKKSYITLIATIYFALFFYANSYLINNENYIHKPNIEYLAVTSKSPSNSINKVFINKSPINLRENNNRENKKRPSFLFKFYSPSCHIRRTSNSLNNYILKKADNTYNEMLYSYFKERLIE